MSVKPEFKGYRLQAFDIGVGHLDVDVPWRGKFDLPIMAQDTIYP